MCLTEGIIYYLFYIIYNKSIYLAFCVPALTKFMNIIDTKQIKMHSLTIAIIFTVLTIRYETTISTGSGKGVSCELFTFLWYTRNLEVELSIIILRANTVDFILQNGYR